MLSADGDRCSSGMDEKMKVILEDIKKEIRHNRILDGISLKMEGGKIYGLQGKNGSGKTMLLKTICGLLRPTEGKVWIDGEQLGVNRDFPEDVGALIEVPQFIGWYTAFQNLSDLAQIRDRITPEDIDAVIEEVGLTKDKNKKFRQYSLGMKQKLGIAAAIMENPKLILLDEPTNALDEESVERLRYSLMKRREEGSLIVIASHDAEELSFLSDEIFILEGGKIKRSYCPEN